MASESSPKSSIHENSYPLIGATASVPTPPFSKLLDAVRLRTLPIPNSHELAQVRIADMSGARGSHNRNNAVTYLIWEQIKKRQEALSGIFAWSDGSLNLSPAGEVRTRPGLWVSGEFFQTLGLQPILGRLLTSANDHRGCRPYVCAIRAGAGSAVDQNQSG